MNKDKAIQLLERLQDPEPYEPKLTKDAYDALQMAIDALSADGDTISRKAAIEEAEEWIEAVYCDHDEKRERIAIKHVINGIKQLPPALPEPMKIDLSRYSEEDWERIKKEWANTPITTIAAQPYTIIDGRLFITVDDIEQVDCVLVAEYKSKFCREFWMADADEPARPERIKGHWVNGHCDKCNAHAPFWAMASTYYESNFCPNCGAEMKREVTT